MRIGNGGRQRGDHGRARRGAGVATLVAIALLVAAAPAAAQLDMRLLYAPAEAARAINDGAPDAPGLTDTLRQAPVFEDPRWPASRLVAKVSGADLSRMRPSEMARALRAAWADPRVGDHVAVDELTAADWDEAQSEALEEALGLLGHDARKVILYLGPGLVSQIGRVDLRRPLESRLVALLEALRGAGAVQLEMYHGDRTPFTDYEFAVYSTRFLARWAPGDPDRLHLLLGPAKGVPHEEIWRRARATPAGRDLLDNGAGVYGLPDAAEGLSWLRAYRAFLADPAAAPPGGDFAVPSGGGLTVTPPQSRTATLVLSRAGRAVVRVIPAGGGRARVVAKVNGPTNPEGVAIRLPADLEPGRYRLVTVALGQDLRDTENVGFTVGDDWGARGVVRSLNLEYRGGTLRLSVGSGYRAVVRLLPPRGEQRVIAKVQGAVDGVPIDLPADLVPGPYRAVAVAVGPNGRQGAGARFRVEASRG
jgi:hypothetical protein